jgi:hypothetical protein
MARKRNVCKFCLKPMVNLFRHLKTMHKTNNEIIAVSVATPDEGKKMLSNIKRDGNIFHNMTILKNGTGSIIPVRQTNGAEYTQCKSCMGFYSGKRLSRHTKICNKKPRSKNDNKR